MPRNLDLSETPELSFLTDAQIPPAEKVERNISEIIGWQDLARSAGSYACLLSGGDLSISGAPEGQGHIDTKAILTDMGLYERYLFARNDGNTLRNMSGYNHLVRSEWQTKKGGRPGGHPFDKFYVSLDLTTDDKVAQGGEFFRGIVEGAQDQGALLSTKDYIHAYDALLLYTYRGHSGLVAKVLQSLYPKYHDMGLFYATRHFFQGQINGISPEYIGFVHEPAVSLANYIGSHSGRMGRLGGVIDGLADPEDLEEKLIPAAFTVAAAAGNVYPEYPYMMPERLVAQ